MSSRRQRWVRLKRGIQSGMAAAAAAISRLGSESAPPDPRRPALLLPPASPGSLGDEAMVAVCAGELRRRGCRRVSLLAYAPGDRWDGAAPGAGSLYLGDYFSSGFLQGLDRFLDWLPAYGSFYCLGADCMDGHYSIAGSLRRLKLVALAARAGLETTILGFSFNPEAPEEVVRAFRALPPSVRLCARDPRSHRRLVTRLGRPVELVADLAFELSPETSSVAPILEWAAAERRGGATLLGLNLNAGPFAAAAGGEPGRLVAIYRDALERLAAEDPSLRFVLLPHDYRRAGSMPSDAELAADLFAALPDELRGRCRRPSATLSAAAARGIAAALDGVVSGRMHLAIAAAAEGIPMAGIAYQGKFEGLFEQFGIEPRLLSPAGLAAPGALATFLGEFLADREAIRRRLRAGAAEVRRRSRANLPEPGALNARPGSRARVLVVSPEPTHPIEKGNRARIVEMSSRLSELGCRVELAHVERYPAEREPMARAWGEAYHPVPYRSPRSLLRRAVRRLKGALTGDYSYRVDDWYADGSSPYLRRLLATLRPHAVIVNYVYLSKALTLLPPGVLKVIDTHDVYTGRFEHCRDEGGRRTGFSTTRSEERRGLRRADLVVAIQDSERRWLEELTGGEVLTIGHRVRVDPLPVHDPPRRAVLFFGSRNEANRAGLRALCEAVLPRVRWSLPEVELVLAGPICDLVPDEEGVRKLGRVDSPRQAYEAADLVVVPVPFGTGLKIKTVEALGYGRPLVSTSVGVEGLEEGRESAFVVADGDEAFAAAVVGLLGDGRRCRSLAAAAVAFAGEYNEACDAGLRRLAERFRSRAGRSEPQRELGPGPPQAAPVAPGRRDPTR